MKIITLFFVLFIISSNFINCEEDFDLSFDDSYLLENNAKPLSEIIFRDDKVLHNDSLFTGITFEKYENGKLKILEKYREGLKDGFFFSWYENNQIRQEFYYLMGNKHGICQTWYKNGQKQMQGYFAYGHLNGTFKGWDETGLLIFDMNYTDDARREASKIEEEIDGDAKDSAKE